MDGGDLDLDDDLLPGDFDLDFLCNFGWVATPLVGDLDLDFDLELELEKK